MTRPLSKVAEAAVDSPGDITSTSVDDLQDGFISTP